MIKESAGKNPLISIIVPVFNVEKYLNGCLSSIVAQSYSHFEALLVDDGSTDGSGKVCDLWAERDSRFKAFHKSNGGLSDARNYGIDKSKGEYLTFVDSDDLIADDYLERLLSLAVDNDCGISICNLKHWYGCGHPQFEDVSKVTVFSSEDAIVELLYQKSFLVAACGKLFKSSCFSDIRFPVGVLYEDSAIMYRLFGQSRLIVSDNARLYAYFHRDGSITTKQFDDRDFDIWLICKQIASDFSDAEYPLRRAATSYQFSAALRLILNVPKGLYADGIYECSTWAKAHAVEVLLDRNARLKNRIAALLYRFCPALLRLAYRKIDRWA